MSTLYHYPKSLSSAAAQVVLELNAPVTIRVLRFANGQFVSDEEPELRLPTGGMGLIGPVRSCPVYRDESGTTLVQCAAIIEHLCDRFDPSDRLRPAAAKIDRARHLSRMVFAEATFFPVVQFLSAEGSTNDNDREEVRRERFRGLIAPFLVEELGSRPYLFGDEVSACDLLMGIPCLNNAAFAGVLDDFPILLDYFERLRARPSFAQVETSDDPSYGPSVVEMVATAHGDRWDFRYRAPHER